MLDILKLPQGLKRLAFEVEESQRDDPRLRLPIYLKYALRCLTSCMRSNTAVSLLVNSETGVKQIIDFLEFGMDEEVQANSAKIIRTALREDFVSALNC